MRKLFVTALFCVSAIGGLMAQGTATIRTKMVGTDRDLIYFDFMEHPEAAMEFPYKDGRVVEFDVELAGVTMLKINTFVLVVVQPGDEIDVEIQYQDRNYRDARFSGKSVASVAASTAINRMRAMRMTRGYKTNIPAALVVQTPPDVFFTSSVQEWKDELAILEEVRGELTPEVYNFVRSELDAIFIPNIITYPGSSAQDGYWSALDGYEMRDDDASLRNFAYLGILGTYKQYARQRDAHAKGGTYVRNETMQEEFADTAGFYDGKLRDAALFVLLYNILASGQDFEAAEVLVDKYKADYNLNPEYVKTLEKVMQ